MSVSALFCVCLLVSVTNAAKILGVFMTPSYSHQIVFQPIWKELSLRGHQVTIYTPNPLNDKSLVNLTEYDLGFSSHLIKGIDQVGQSIDKIFSIYEGTAELQLNHTYLRNLINNVDNNSYDLFLVEYFWPPMYSFKDVYKIPMVGITSLPLTVRGSDALGMDKHPVVDPDLLLKFSYAETFTQRVESWIFKWLYRFAYRTKLNNKLNAQIIKHFGKDARDTYSLTGDASLVLANYNYALQNVKPMVPNFIPISGIHIKPLKPLPKDLANLLHEQKNDIIYFSFGTNVRVSELCKQKINRVLSVLGRLPYTILWKYESNDLPQDLPKNFIVRKWFPQQDVLGHPKVKLFITQGGLQSIDEALSRKVPMLLVPFLADQVTNSDRCVRLGIGESIDFNSFTDHEFEIKLSNLLTDSSYRKNINKQSRIASDQPLSSLETAIFWIEYVLRHDGAPHLKYKAVDLPFYQYYLLDVYLFVGMVFTTLIFTLKKGYVLTKRYVAMVFTIIIFTVKRRFVLTKLHILSNLFSPSKEKKEI